VGPYEQATPNFERLREWAAADPRRLPEGRQPLCVGIAHDMPGITPPEQMRFDCCIEVGEACRAADGVGVQTILGATFDVALHQGTFATLGDTYARLARELIPASGARIASGASVELYLTPPELSMNQPIRRSSLPARPAAPLADGRSCAERVGSAGLALVPTRDKEDVDDGA
jgi:AraC family transcriptional regulator